MVDSQKVLHQFLEVAAVPGVSRKERQIIDYLKTFLSTLGFGCWEDGSYRAFHGEAGNLICKISNSGGHTKSVLLAAHVDTISLSCEKPIAKDERVVSSDDRILGADDRVGVTVLLEILKLIANKKIDYPNLEIVFLVAEEVGLLGSKNLDYSLIEAKHAFNLDCSAPVGHAVIAAPSVIDFEITFIGRDAHSATGPEEGINAITMASEAINQMNLPQKCGETIFNIGKIRGGDKNNIIPKQVLVTGEIRSFDAGKIDEYLKRIETVARSVTHRFHAHFELEHHLRYDAYALSEESLVYKIAQEAIENARLPFVPIRYLAGSDASNFNRNHVSSINMGLGYKNNHSSQESIAVSDLTKNVEIGARLVHTSAALIK